MPDPRTFLKNIANNTVVTESTPVPSNPEPEEPIDVHTQPEPVHPTPQKVQARPVDFQNKKQGTGANKVARLDVPIETYGVNPVTSAINIYNMELHEFLGSFSARNQFRGGAAINKSTLIEVILDVAMYDMGLQPQGFQSAQELREFLQSKIK
jgi:hypothetical protein